MSLVQVGGTRKWLLFVNWGACCNGRDSTYEIRVGMADSAAGPFKDKERSEPSSIASTNLTTNLSFQNSSNEMSPKILINHPKTKFYIFLVSASTLLVRTLFGIKYFQSRPDLFNSLDMCHFKSFIKADPYNSELIYSHLHEKATNHMVVVCDTCCTVSIVWTDLLAWKIPLAVVLYFRGLRPL